MSGMFNEYSICWLCFGSDGVVVNPTGFAFPVGRDVQWGWKHPKILRTLPNSLKAPCFPEPFYEASLCGLNWASAPGAITFLVLSVTMTGFLSMISYSVQSSLGSAPTFTPASALSKTLVCNTSLFIFHSASEWWEVIVTYVEPSVWIATRSAWENNHSAYSCTTEECIVLRSVFCVWYLGSNVWIVSLKSRIFNFDVISDETLEWEQS